MKTLILRSLALLTLLLVVACGGGISQESYDKVKNGMSLEEVEGILGKHTSGGGGGGEAMGMKISAGAYKWEDGSKLITITFSNDKVTMKVRSGF